MPDATTNGGEITVATANSYINSFITNYFNTDKAPVKSMIMDADLLRSYLQNDDIVGIKFMLGATDYDHNGSQIPIFTLIVAGYDANGNYVLTSNGMVLDRTSPCPPSCPPSGNAANDTIS